MVEGDAYSYDSGGIDDMTLREKLNDKSSSRSELRNMLHFSDAFVLTTRGEGWGLPIAEAMSMRLPVVVPNVLGPMSYVNEENGYIIPVDLSKQLINGYPQIEVNDVKVALERVYLENKYYYRSYRSKRKVKCPEEEEVEYSPRGLKARETIQNISSKKTVYSMVQRIRKLLEERGWENV